MLRNYVMTSIRATYLSNGGNTHRMNSFEVFFLLHLSDRLVISLYGAPQYYSSRNVESERCGTGFAWGDSLGGASTVLPPTLPVPRRLVTRLTLRLTVIAALISLPMSSLPRPLPRNLKHYYSSFRTTTIRCTTISRPQASLIVPLGTYDSYPSLVPIFT